MSPTIITTDEEEIFRFRKEITSNYQIRDPVVTRTINSNSNIRAYGPYVYAGYLVLNSFIQEIGQTVTIDSNYFISKAYSKTLISDAYIKKTRYWQRFCSYFIKKLDNVTIIDSNANIKATYSGTITSNARIKSAFEGSIYSNYKIKQTYSKTIDSNAKIKKIDNLVTINSDAWISVELIGSITSDSYIQGTPSKTITSNYYVKVLDNVKTIVSNYFIEKTGNIKTITSNARIKSFSQNTIFSNAKIKQTYAQSVNSNAKIKKLGNIYMIVSDAWIRGVATKTINSNGMIKQAYTNTINSNAFIVRITKGILISPANGSTLADYYVNFTFYVSETYIGNINAQIQIATDPAFASLEFNEYSFRPETGVWEYYSGGSWIAFPTTGIICHAKQTIQGRVRYDLLTGLKYWRVRGVVR